MAASLATAGARAMEEGRKSGPKSASDETPLLEKQRTTEGSEGGDAKERGEYDLELNSKEIKAEFVQKVYGILSFQLLFTAGICAATIYYQPARSLLVAMMANPYFQIINAVVMIGMLCLLMCVADKTPINFIVLLAWTGWVGFGVGGAVSIQLAKGNEQAVVCALGTTMLIFVVLSLYAAYSGKDFSFMGGFLIVALICNIVLGLIAYMFHFPIMLFLYNVFGVMIFSAFILYDTDQIVNRTALEEISTGTAIMGAVNLYLDVITIFLSLMSLFGDR